MYEYFIPANTQIPKITASLKKHSFLHIDLSTDWLKKKTQGFLTPGDLLAEISGFDD